jgi:hypothetical protein
MQKYHMKSSVRSCESWRDLNYLLLECKKRRMISMKSANYLWAEVVTADKENFKEFNSIRDQLGKALNGKAIVR